MFRIASESELLNAFRPIDRDQVSIPRDIQFPLAVQDYFAWVEPHVRSFLVFQERESQQLLGILFRQSKSSPEAQARMCEWCHSVRSADQVGLLSVQVNNRQVVGLNLCRDLGCKERILKELPSVQDMRETLVPSQKLVRVLEKMNLFARRTIL